MGPANKKSCLPGWQTLVSNCPGKHLKLRRQKEKLMEKVLHVQAADWQGIEASSKPVFVDFWADWCGPCKMLGPTFERLAEKYGDTVTFAKVNVDEMPDVANKFAIRSIPTLVLLQAGNVVERLVGLRSEQELAQVLSRYTNAIAPK
jgi:thioredoxin